MKTKTIQFVPAILAVVAIGFRYFSQWCIGEGQLCFRTLLDRIYLYIINPVFYFAIFLLPISAVLIFVPREIFKSWLKLAVWAIPLAIIFITLTPDSNPGAYIDPFPFYRDDAARLAGGVFAAASFILIAWKYFSSSRNKRA